MSAASQDLTVVLSLSCDLWVDIAAESLSLSLFPSLVIISRLPLRLTLIPRLASLIFLLQFSGLLGLVVLLHPWLNRKVSPGDNIFNSHRWFPAALFCPGYMVVIFNLGRLVGSPPAHSSCSTPLQVCSCVLSSLAAKARERTAAAWNVYVCIPVTTWSMWWRAGVPRTKS